MKTVSIVILVLSLSACSALPKFSAVAPTICAYATAAEAQAAVNALASKLPEGTDKKAALDALRLAETSADAVCVLIKALEVKQP